MDVLIDKVLLLLLSSLLLFGQDGVITPVIAFLAALIAAALGYYIEEKKYMYLVFFIAFIMAVGNPMTMFFLAVYLYDVVYKKLYWLSAILGLYALPVFTSLDTMQKCLFGMSAVLAVFLAKRTLHRQYLAEELIRIRDDSTERNLILKEKNKNLLEKQDYEIYLATLRERNRIAREIHDNVGHMLSRSLLMTGALLTIEKEGIVHDQLQNIRDTLDTAMTNIRQSVHDLHDDSIDLRQSIREIIEPIQQEYEVRLDYDMSNQVPRKVKYCLIATTKEAVSNILKHSNGNMVQIRLREHPGFYQLAIEDNGKNAKIETGSGIGLSNMKERADSLSGTFRIQTENGFGIFMTIPKTEELLCE